MEQILTALLERGWPGIIVGIALFALWKMWGVIEQKQARIDEIQEKRMSEALENIRSAIAEYLAVVSSETQGADVREVDVAV